MKITPSIAIAAALVSSLHAGSVFPETVSQTTPTTTTSTGGFENARRPISNPTLFDLALPGTNVHPIFIHQSLPSYVNTTAGEVPMGGDFQVYALQFEIALNERLSIVATKDGYVDINPGNSLWGDEAGFANVAAGLKYAFYYDPANSAVVSGTATFEFPIGNHDVFQGEGDGAVNLILSGLKLWDKFQLAAGAGVHLELDDQLANTSFVSAHASYEVSKWFIPLVEINWHHVLTPGDGESNFDSQAGGLVPVIATFEGADLLNFGASNAAQNRDFVTAAAGFRSRITDSIDIGAAYEIPLTNEHDGILKDRVTVDLLWKF